MQCLGNSLRVLIVASGVLGVLSTSAAGAELVKLGPPPGANWFGFSTATDGNFVVVGDLGFDDPTVTQTIGVAIVYRREGGQWVQDSVLVPQNPSAIKLYGYSVAIDHDIIAVGAYSDFSVCQNFGDCSMGSVNVFRHEPSGWVFEAKLFPSGAPEETRYGQFVSLSEGRAVVSAPSETDATGQLRGAVYIFRREGTSWVDEARIDPSDIADGSAISFTGNAFALDAERLLLSATTIDGDATAYVFRRAGTTWTEEAQLVLPTPDGRSQFGPGPFVDLSGDVAVVGGAASNAFVYLRGAGGWSFDATLSNLDLVAGGQEVKTSVNTDGFNVLVSTIAGNSPSVPASTFAVYQRDDHGWIRDSVLQPSSDIIVSTQGAPTDMRDGLVTVGARLPGTTLDFSTSSAYVFDAPVPAFNSPGPLVPAVSTWGLVMMVLMLMSAATWIVKRRMLTI